MRKEALGLVGANYQRTHRAYWMRSGSISIHKGSRYLPN